MTLKDGNNQLPFGKYYASMALETVVLNLKLWIANLGSCPRCNGIPPSCCEKICEGTVESADEKDDQLKHWLSQEYVLLGIKYYVLSSSALSDELTP